MQADQFRSALRTKPFKPFTVRTSSGEFYTVTHPEIVGISPSGKTIVIALDAGAAVLDMDAVTEYVVGAAKGKGRKATQE